jgi:hypothetical protein
MSERLAPATYFFGETLAPLRLALESPIAIACFLFFTFLPLLLRRVPFLRRRMVLLTDFCAPFPYLAIVPPCDLLVSRLVHSDLLELVNLLESRVRN